MNCWIAFGLAPESIRSEAKVCRHSWSVIGLSEIRSRLSVSASSHSRLWEPYCWDLDAAEVRDRVRDQEVLGSIVAA